jgi:hypothetical protein
MTEGKQPAPKTSSSKSYLNSKRKFILVGTALLIIALPIMVYKVLHDWRTLQSKRAELVSVKKQSSDLVVLQESINQYKKYHNELKQLMQDANSSTLGSDYWIERKVEINKKKINRSEAAGFLAGAGKDTDSFFKTAMFEIHTVQIGDDLFNFRQGDASEVQMTMNGQFYSKIKNK